MKTQSAETSSEGLNISWPKNKLLLRFDVDLNTQFGFNLQIGWSTGHGLSKHTYYIEVKMYRWELKSRNDGKIYLKLLLSSINLLW